MEELQSKINECIRCKKHEQAVNIAFRPNKLSIEEQTVVVKKLVDSLCVAGNLNQVLAVVTKAHKSTFCEDDFVEIVSTFIKRGRFELAARSAASLGLTNDAFFVSKFIEHLSKHRQFKLAMTWAEKLSQIEPVGLSEEDIAKVYCWTPERLIGDMIQSKTYDQALKYIFEFSMQEKFPPVPCIAELFRQSNISTAMSYIRKFKLDNSFPLDQIIQDRINVCRWSDVTMILDAKKELKNKYTSKVLLGEMVRLKDWLAALTQLPRFGFTLSGEKSISDVPEENRQYLDLVLDGMIKDGALYKAMELVILFQVFEKYPPISLVKIMIAHGQYSQAIKYIKMLNLQEHIQAEEFQHMESERTKSLVNFRRLMRKRRRQMVIERNEPTIHNKIEIKRLPWSVSTTTLPIAEIQNDIALERLKLKEREMKMQNQERIEQMEDVLIANQGVASDSDSDDDEEEIIMMSASTSQRPKTVQPNQTTPIKHPNFPVNGPPMGLSPPPRMMPFAMAPIPRPFHPIPRPMYPGSPMQPMPPMMPPPPRPMYNSPGIPMQNLAVPPKMQSNVTAPPQMNAQQNRRVQPSKETQQSTQGATPVRQEGSKQQTPNRFNEEEFPTLSTSSNKAPRKSESVVEVTTPQPEPKVVTKKKPPPMFMMPTQVLLSRKKKVAK